MGIGRSGTGKDYSGVILRLRRTGQGQWMAIGGYLGGCHVKEIYADAALLTERQTGREFRLYLAGPAAGEAGDAAERRKNWINSEENPMCFAPFKLPAEVIGGWTNLSEEEKARVVAVYRDFGWNLVVVEPAGSSPQFSWKNIYKEQRKDAMARARVEFENSLDPAQMLIFAKIKATWDGPASAGKSPASREEIEADNRVRQTEWPRLKATLSPMQQELYESMSNPLKAMMRAK